MNGWMTAVAIWCAMRAAAEQAALADRYRAIRCHSIALISGLSAEDCAAQAMPDASPQKWHLAHTSWFFETFVLAVAAPDYRSPEPAYRQLFNSYYQSVGPQHPRPQRGLLTRPSLCEVLAWRAVVDEAMLRAIDAGRADAAWVELGLQHEQQHQELMRSDLLALMALNPLRPSLFPRVTRSTWTASATSTSSASLAPSTISTNSMPSTSSAELAVSASSMAWLPVRAGVVRVGHDGDGFCFDNELPAHEVVIGPFEIARALVKQRDYLAFIDDGGYRDPAWWLADGWDWIQSGRRTGPQYWRTNQGRGWLCYGLDGECVIRHDGGAQITDQEARESDAALDGAMAHLSYYEADAYARWAGARLPTEQEWETAARTQGDTLHGLFGDCWQWTASAYAAYPGFRPRKGAAGEYNGKFMVNQQVLRGSSAYTPSGHARISYRNFFPAAATWQRSGLRLAR